MKGVIVLVKWDIAKLKKASEEDINSVDIKEIADSTSYQINTKKMSQDRLSKYLLNCKNPYITRHKKVLIKLEYQNKKTLSELFIEILSRHQD